MELLTKRVIPFMYKMPEAILVNPPLENQSCDSKVDNYADIPKGEMDIFYKEFNQFIPVGKQWDDLTNEEKEIVKNKYRFSPLIPSTYQGITGLGKMIN